MVFQNPVLRGLSFLLVLVEEVRCGPETEEMEDNGHNHHDVLAGIMADATDLVELEKELSNKDAAEKKAVKEEENKRKERTSAPWTSTSSKHGQPRSESNSSEKDKRSKSKKPEEERLDVGKEVQKESGGIAV
jgi:hypothetical protein